MAKIKNDEVRRYFLTLRNLLHDTDINFALAKLFGSEAGDLLGRLKELQRDTYNIYSTVQLFGEPAVVEAIDDCFEIYSQIKESRRKWFSSLQLLGYSKVENVSLVGGFPTIDKDAVPDLEQTLPATIHQSWGEVMDALDTTLLIWSEYKKNLQHPTTKPTEISKSGKEMKVVEASKIQIGKLTPAQSESLYSICERYKVFKYTSRSVFADGFKPKGANALTIKTNLSFATLYLSCRGIFKTEDDYNQFICSWGDDVATKIKRLGTTKLNSNDTQRQFKIDLNKIAPNN